MAQSSPRRVTKTTTRAHHLGRIFGISHNYKILVVRARQIREYRNARLTAELRSVFRVSHKVKVGRHFGNLILSLFVPIQMCGWMDG
jgi:hypothetical protein